jgi:hypothetical protein
MKVLLICFEHTFSRDILFRVLIYVCVLNRFPLTLFAYQVTFNNLRTNQNQKATSIEVTFRARVCDKSTVDLNWELPFSNLD